MIIINQSSLPIFPFSLPRMIKKSYLFVFNLSYLVYFLNIEGMLIKKNKIEIIFKKYRKLVSHNEI